MTITKETVFAQINKKWYAQGFNCTPLLLSPPGMSGFDVEQTIGDKYTEFLWDYKNNYGKMYYLVDDLIRLGKILVKNIKEDPNYVHNLRTKDQELQKELITLTKKISNINSLSKGELITFLKELVQANRDVGKISHIIEGFSLTTDTEINEELEKHIQDEKEFNRVLSLLSTPNEASFINEREEDLFKISKLENKESAIKKHLQEFSWVNNTYAGKVKLTKEDLLEELEDFHYEPIDFAKIKKEKQEAIEKYNLHPELVTLLTASADITAWQDERKKTIFIIIEQIENVLKELSKRINIPKEFLRYITYNETKTDILNTPNLKEILEERKRGMIHYAIATDEDIILTGQDYQEFHKRIGEAEKALLETKEFKGMVARPGLAIGNVRVCKNIESIREFQHGEILVASMTRPEYLPAMKKAAAIVTDEGGITCHAAIVSRELGIPCVIGTKIATKLLQDGDRVEVKANHGLIIKR